ncbi:hypothetical protein BCR34DRAFT_633224 [Clohesyomyces aquaticus]|uniref:Uncharacterized protein n=1 Tax=Clohesyomyces aquaticus TaxID=1231657 RepID=A0A1Y1Z453_9PLEO|nr:hypothetical protein BCR34DRAFT_633224 [Clohesyomyces aquaticus]
MRAPPVALRTASNYQKDEGNIDFGANLDPPFVSAPVCDIDRHLGTFLVDTFGLDAYPDTENAVSIQHDAEVAIGIARAVVKEVQQLSQMEQEKRETIWSDEQPEGRNLTTTNLKADEDLWKAERCLEEKIADLSKAAGRKLPQADSPRKTFKSTAFGRPLQFLTKDAELELIARSAGKQSGAGQHSAKKRSSDVSILSCGDSESSAPIVLPDGEYYCSREEAPCTLQGYRGGLWKPALKDGRPTHSDNKPASSVRPSTTTKRPRQEDHNIIFEEQIRIGKKAIPRLLSGLCKRIVMASPKSWIRSDQKVALPLLQDARQRGRPQGQTRYRRRPTVPGRPRAQKPTIVERAITSAED